MSDRILVLPEQNINPESLGTKVKFWIEREGKEKWLCKIVRPNTGEDWAEIVAQRIAALFGLPYAWQELATYKGQNAVISKNFLPENCSLALGNTLLSGVIPNYPRNQKYKLKLHTLPNVYAALIQINADAALGLNNAFDQFMGYLLLDAIIGNTDRHHENWGIIRNEITGDAYLAPTFDHGSSLGCRFSADQCIQRLKSKDNGFNVYGFVRNSRATSALFLNDNDTKPLNYVDAFLKTEAYSQETYQLWQSKLASIDLTTPSIFSHILMNPANIAFAQALILENKSRILK